MDLLQRPRHHGMRLGAKEGGSFKIFYELFVEIGTIALAMKEATNEERKREKRHNFVTVPACHNPRREGKRIGQQMRPSWFLLSCHCEFSVPSRL